MRRSSWSVALLGLLALACAMGIGRFAFTPILPMMQKEMGLAVEHAGWIASANYLGYFAGALWTMIQRAQPRRAIRLALVVTTLSTLAMAYADGLAAWLLLRFIAGVASAWALVYVASWCFERLSALGKSSLNGIVFTGVGVGIIVAGGLCLVIMALGAGAREAWLSLGGIALACTVLAWPVLGVTGETALPVQAPKIRSSPDAMHLVACYGAFGFAYIVPATFIPAMASQAIADPVVFGWAWPIFGLAAGISTLTAGALSRAFGNRTVWIGCALTMAAGVAAPLVLSGLAGILVCSVLVGSTFVAITMVGIQEARVVAKDSASALVAAMTAAFAAGQVVGPLAVSAVGGFAPALALAAAALLASAALLRFSYFTTGAVSKE